LLVVLSLLAVLLPMAGGTIFFLLRAQSQSTEALRDAMGITQLSQTFRSDVHAARSVHRAARRPAVDGIVLELEDSRTIEYQSEADGWVSRTARRGEIQERREQFRVGAARPKFQLADEGREVAVTIAPRPRRSIVPNDAGPPAGIRIAAIVGRNSRVGALPVGEVRGPSKAASKNLSTPKDRKTP
jgi:hypothetical protein